MKKNFERLLKSKVSSDIKSQFEKHAHLLKEKEEFLATGTLIELTSSDILNDDTFQIRTEEVSSEKFENLKASIKENGQQVPILVRKQGDKYQIIAGFHRYRALKELHKPIIAISKDVNDDQASKISEIENLQRNNLSILDIYNYIKKLEAKGLNQVEIGARLNVTDRMVRNYLRIGENKELFELVKKDIITAVEAIKLLKLPENALKNKIRSLENLTGSKTENKTAKKKIIGTGKDFSINKERNKIKISLSGTYRNKEKVIERLKAIIEEIKNA